MSIMIKDGRTSQTAKVDGNSRVHVQSVIETEAQHAAETGKAFNLNSGEIVCTAAGSSSLIYVKNNELSDIVIDSIIVGVDDTATHTGVPRVNLCDNVVGGDLVSDATAVPMKRNRRLGDSTQLLADIYKGKPGGDAVCTANALLFASKGNRLFAELDYHIAPGQTMALTADPKITAGTSAMYVAVSCHIKDPASSD